MTRKQTFLAADWSEPWKESYARLSADRQASCDETAIALIKQASSSGLRVKPIQPDKHYLEARSLSAYLTAQEKSPWREALGKSKMGNLDRADEV